MAACVRPGLTRSMAGPACVRPGLARIWFVARSFLLVATTALPLALYPLQQLAPLWPMPLLGLVAACIPGAGAPVAGGIIFLPMLRMMHVCPRDAVAFSTATQFIGVGVLTPLTWLVTDPSTFCLSTLPLCAPPALLGLLLALYPLTLPSDEVVIYIFTTFCAALAVYTTHGLLTSRLQTDSPSCGAAGGAANTWRERADLTVSEAAASSVVAPPPPPPPSPPPSPPPASEKGLERPLTDHVELVRAWRRGCVEDQLGRVEVRRTPRDAHLVHHRLVEIWGHVAGVPLQGRCARRGRRRRGRGRCGGGRCGGGRGGGCHGGPASRRAALARGVEAVLASGASPRRISAHLGWSRGQVPKLLACDGSAAAARRAARAARARRVLVAWASMLPGGLLTGYIGISVEKVLFVLLASGALGRRGLPETALECARSAEIGRDRLACPRPR